MSRHLKTAIIFGGVIAASLIVGYFLATASAKPSKTISVKQTASQQKLDFEQTGGVILRLEADIPSVVAKALENEREAMRREFYNARRVRTNGLGIRSNSIIVKFRNPEDLKSGMEILRERSMPIDPKVSNGANTTQIEQLGDREFKITFTPQYVRQIQERMVERSIDVLKKRIDPTGEAGVVFTPDGANRILLKIPGSMNLQAVKDRISRVANLSFHVVRPESNSEKAMRLAAEGKIPPGAAYFKQQGGGALLVEKRTKLTGDCIETSEEDLHPKGGYPIVRFSFDDNCKTIFGDLTAKNINKHYAIVLDEEIITAPNIKSAMIDGSGIIEGSFTLKSARELAWLLNAGALPTKLVIAEERFVDAKPGHNTTQKAK